MTMTMQVTVEAVGAAGAAGADVDAEEEEEEDSLKEIEVHHVEEAVGEVADGLVKPQIPLNLTMVCL